MGKAINEKEARKYLAAFADGELDVEQLLSVLDHMSMNPQSTRRVMHQQQLRQAVGRVMQHHTPSPSDELRQQVEDLFDQDVPPQTPATPQLAVVTFRRWVPTIVAAVLLICTLAILGVQSYSQGRSNGSILRISLDESELRKTTRSFQHRHVECAGLPGSLVESDRFPTDLAVLPRHINDYLGTWPTPALDLTKLGYRFERVGKCTLPGGQSMHMIYRAMPETGRRDTMSLWMKVDDRALDLEPGRIYAATDQNAVHPILVWRQGNMIYYLVGDVTSPMSSSVRGLMGL